MNIIEKINQEIKLLFKNEVSGHDYQHSLRVYQNAMKIANTEACDKNIVAIAALLHDADDSKLFSSDDYENARAIIRRAGIDCTTAQQVIEVIKEVPFKGSDSTVPSSIEGKIVQDADRLDALGAVGIARTFAFGGCYGLPIYDPDNSFNDNMDGETYKTRRSSSVNHFYEKLFKLKDMMNTKVAYEIAVQRDAFLHLYMDELLCELEEG